MQSGKRGNEDPFLTYNSTRYGKRANSKNATRADYARKSNSSQEVIWRLLCDMVLTAAGGRIKLQEGVVPLLVQLHNGSLVSAPVTLSRRVAPRDKQE